MRKVCRTLLKMAPTDAALVYKFYLSRMDAVTIGMYIIEAQLRDYCTLFQAGCDTMVHPGRSVKTDFRHIPPFLLRK